MRTRTFFRAVSCYRLLLALLLCGIIGAAQPTLTLAQIFPVETLRYGFRPLVDEESGEVRNDAFDLVAYRLDGEIIPILESTIEDMPRLFALGDNHVLALVREEGQSVYYEVEGTEAAKIELVSDPPTAYFDAYMLLDYQAPYAILSNGQIGTPIVIVDLENDTVQFSNYPTFQDPSRCCISIEGESFQYFAQTESGGETTLGLVERNLASGEERLLFDDPNLLIGTVNASGTRWLLFVGVSDARQREIILWEGQAEVSRETVDLAERVGWVGDTLFQSNILCEPDCSIDLRSPDGTTRTITVVALLKDQMFTPISLLDDGSIIGHVPDALMKIAEDGTLTFLGYLDNFGLTSNGRQMVSLDGRFAALSPNEERVEYKVIDTATGETIIASDPENPADYTYVLYFTEGVLVTSYSDPEVFHYYRASDQQLFELPSENMRYFEVLDDDTLLYFERGEEAFIQIGAYQLDSGEKQPLLEGIQPLQVQPAIR